MQVNITARHLEIAEQFKIYVAEKISKLTRYSSKIEEARVIFSSEKYIYVCEIVLTGKDLRMTATEKEKELRSSFDAAMSNMEEQLKKFRARFKKHKVARFFEDLKSFTFKKKEPAKSGPYMIKPEPLSTKPMSPEEAASELELFEKQFIVFRNSDNDKINVLYRRKDGNYGLIE